MKTTGIFTLSKYEIPFKKYGDTVLLRPFGDIHRFAPLHHKQKWQEWLETCSKEPNAYFLGMGDYFDLGSTSERAILNNRNIHDSTKQTLDDLYRDNVNKMAKEMSFMKGRLIGLIEGNHYAELVSGITTTQLLCEKLDCKYLGVSAFIRILLNKVNSQAHAIDVWAHHGLGGGRTAGASINKIENMIKAANADIYLMAHDHKKHIAMQSRLRLNEGGGNLALENRKIIMARTGSFLCGYVDGEASYIADGAYSPVDLGTVTIRMTPTRTTKTENGKRIDKRRVEMRASL